jgi:hypothetical protein
MCRSAHVDLRRSDQTLAQRRERPAEEYVPIAYTMRTNRASSVGGARAKGGEADGVASGLIWAHDRCRSGLRLPDSRCPCRRGPIRFPWR